MQRSSGIRIETREEYDYCASRGYEPLRDKRFDLDHDLRIEIQREKFGRGNKEENNIRFYHYAWKIAEPKVCEECGKPLNAYSSVFISHCCSRGAYPDLAYDLRNFCLLCYEHHQMYENPITRKGMRIYDKTERIREKLLKEYRGL